MLLPSSITFSLQVKMLRGSDASVQDQVKHECCSTKICAPVFFFLQITLIHISFMTKSTFLSVIPSRVVLVSCIVGPVLVIMKTSDKLKK